eukprot:scaffold30405_cov15-Tisochrysis_lutea.AAC.2
MEVEGRPLSFSNGKHYRSKIWACAGALAGIGKGEKSVFSWEMEGMMLCFEPMTVRFKRDGVGTGICAPSQGRN